MILDNGNLEGYQNGFISPLLFLMGSFRGAKPLSHNLPLFFEGEGDTGGEDDSWICLNKSLRN
jgi:hypothetical protein